MSQKNEIAVFGAGCFWCVEAVFQRLRGVTGVVSGYTGGHVARPSYEQVCRGDTGHAEVCEITFDPDQVSYEALLDVFFHTHDPTTLNRQGADQGSQYRSAVFYVDEAQKAKAQAMKEQLTAGGEFSDPIVTEISPLGTFFPAEDYHQNYFNTNPGQGYCTVVIQPKISAFRLRFQNLLKRAE